MFTKLLVGATLTLAMGASLYTLYNPSAFSSCCPLQRAARSVCCSTPSTESTAPSCCTESCCTPAATVAPGTIFYCPLTEEFYDECCCTLVNGQYVCNVTGTISENCCCYPISD